MELIILTFILGALSVALFYAAFNLQKREIKRLKEDLKIEKEKTKYQAQIKDRFARAYFGLRDKEQQKKITEKLKMKGTSYADKF